MDNLPQTPHPATDTASAAPAAGEGEAGDAKTPAAAVVDFADGGAKGPLLQTRNVEDQMLRTSARLRVFQESVVTCRRSQRVNRSTKTVNCDGNCDES